MPTLPIKMPKQAIRDEAEPVFSCCCSSIKTVLGGRIPLPAMVDGSRERANSHGFILPRPQISTPLAIIMAKKTVIIDPRLNRPDKWMYSIGPRSKNNAFRAK